MRKLVYTHLAGNAPLAVAVGGLGAQMASGAMICTENFTLGVIYCAMIKVDVEKLYIFGLENRGVSLDQAVEIVHMELQQLPR